MHFQQVCLAAMAFAAARGGTLVEKTIAIHTVHGGTNIFVEQNQDDPEAWYVGLYSKNPLHLPSVKTEEQLVKTLAKAWDLQKKRPYLSRFIEEPSSLGHTCHPDIQEPSIQSKEDIVALFRPADQSLALDPLRGALRQKTTDQF